MSGSLLLLQDVLRPWEGALGLLVPWLREPGTTDKRLTDAGLGPSG